MPMTQDDDDASLLADPEIIGLYEAVRAALIENSDRLGDPVAALTRLNEMMRGGHREAAFAISMLCLGDETRPTRRARGRKTR